MRAPEPRTEPTARLSSRPTLPSSHTAAHDSKAWVSIRAAVDPSQRPMTRWIPDAELQQEVVPFERQLTGRLRDALSDSTSPDLRFIERVTATGRFRVDHGQVPIDRRNGFRMGAKARELRMVSIAARTTLQYALHEQSFPPQGYQTLAVEVLRVKGPNPHRPSSISKFHAERPSALGASHAGSRSRKDPRPD